MARSRRCVGIAVVTFFVVAIIIAATIYVVCCHHRITSPPEPPTKKAQPLYEPAMAPEPPTKMAQPLYGPAMVSVEQACQATRNPIGCGATLAAPNDPSLPNLNYVPIKMLRHATRICIRNVKTVQNLIAIILKKYPNDQKVAKPAKTCMEVLQNAEHRQESTLDALSRREIKEARAWMSASLVYESLCFNGLNKTGSDLRDVKDVVMYMPSVVNITSEALSVIRSYDIYRNNTDSWAPPRTERDGFWEYVGGSGDVWALGFKGGFPSGLTANVTVCKSRSGENCEYTFQLRDAVDAAPSNETERKFVIRIKEGVYNETVRVPLEKKNVVFLGDGMGKTVITGSLNVGQPGMTTYDSATVGVLGDGFMAKDLTIENTAGPRGNQAVAFRSDSDRSVLENVEFLGNQDTLCANTLRQFYKSCRIQGNVDFIFGFSASVFQNCLILFSPRDSSSDQNVITAHGRFDPAQTTGFVFLNCTVTGTATYMEKYEKQSSVSVVTSFLGRPWKEYSRTVFINCNLGPIISPEGWLPWDRDFGLATLYYGEYGNSGPGSVLSNRVKWSSRISADHLEAYSVQNFIQGDRWIPLSSG
ncbi:hypothetical protein Vadar_013428 [Vaccinium darrowii]|uniref:Uncharacterized protein n=1 Tax=Vaccinium darrowii TaxID=229202 RepID=A0ACB7XYT7_9ERIC|nr:hypothetical protein Vadar_013428 [Vaccinium darrowii]